MEYDRCGEQCLYKLCMHQVPIFSSLDHEDLVKIALSIGHREYKKGNHR